MDQNVGALCVFDEVWRQTGISRNHNGFVSHLEAITKGRLYRPMVHGKGDDPDSTFLVDDPFVHLVRVEGIASVGGVLQLVREPNLEGIEPKHALDQVLQPFRTEQFKRRGFALRTDEEVG